MSTTSPPVRLSLGGCPVDLLTREQALATVAARLGGLGAGTAPLVVDSVNLDHLHHFAPGSPWRAATQATEDTGQLDWLHLVDGQPVVHRARRVTGHRWPRLAGSDLVDAVLEAARQAPARVGFLGGTEETRDALAGALARTHPGLEVAGHWSPPRAALTDPTANQRLCAEIAAAGTDVLVVCLGKPRQELWIADHGPATGASVLCAFGAVVDFLAGRVARAPEWMSEHSLEWAYRLAHEPRRLAHRYLVDGPPAYLRLHGSATPAMTTPTTTPTATPTTTSTATPPAARSSLQLPRQRSAVPRPVCAIVVTHQSETSIGPLLEDLTGPGGAGRVLVKDNGSTDGTLDVVARFPDVEVVGDHRNSGYAAGINAAARLLGDQPWDRLVLNPDVRIEAGTLGRMAARLARPGVGAVVPRLVDAEGATSPSLRRDPTVVGCVADALLGSRLAGARSETVRDPDSYRYPHPVDWATGAALLVRHEVALAVGPWDERFFLYSEETDYLHRVRDAGWRVWFEPAAVIHHAGGGSGTSPRLDALQAVNRVRYAEKHLGRRAAGEIRAAAVMAALLRLGHPGQRRSLGHLLRRRTWEGLARPS